MWKDRIRPDETITYPATANIRPIRIEKCDGYSPDRLEFLAAKYGVGRGRVRPVEYRGGEWTRCSDTTFRQTGFEGLYRIRQSVTYPYTAGDEFFIYPDGTVEIAPYIRDSKNGNPEIEEAALLYSPRPQITDPIYEGRVFGTDAQVIFPSVNPVSATLNPKNVPVEIFSGSGVSLKFVEIKPDQTPFANTPQSAVNSLFGSSDYGMAHEDNLNYHLDVLESTQPADRDVLAFLKGNFEQLATVVAKNYHVTRGWPQDELRKALDLSSAKVLANLETGLIEFLAGNDQTDELTNQWFNEDINALRNFRAKLLQRTAPGLAV